MIKNFIIEDWWTPSQLAIVKSTDRIWTKKRFETTPGFWKKINGGKLLGKTSNHEEIPPEAIVDNTAWDHEHCELCFETISDREGYQHEVLLTGRNGYA